MKKIAVIIIYLVYTNVIVGTPHDDDDAHIAAIFAITPSSALSLELQTKEDSAIQRIRPLILEYKQNPLVHTPLQKARDIMFDVPTNSSDKAILLDIFKILRNPKNHHIEHILEIKNKHGIHNPTLQELYVTYMKPYDDQNRINR